MSEIVFTDKAYCKIVLHAAKYPYCAINGILLAKSSSKSEPLQFEDAIPLFHGTLNLTPMAEIALTQIDQVASNFGLVIGGYYVAHENLKENSFEKAYNRLTDKIAENFPNSCLVVVDNRKLGNQLDNVALRVAQFSDNRYRPVDIQRITLTPSHTLDLCTTLLEKQIHKSLVDFDNHLDNISQDWTNVHINKEINALI
ncbi:ER membrane protein complex subunit 8/9 homolog [Agrilus planipennis]|uniref:ER membrane protein complex subunit 8/9 homolog n=1 Tax=Agrilus planipennis TaxID=224129 RepID=A0A1W4WIY4_AGRPL|nr:ER membrane protein complex subunit 8/9 homolog [Agrilus planipennis]